MSIRALLFLLFLYVLLAWLVVYYIFGADGPEEIVRRGVFWTAVGVCAVMVWLIGVQVYGWWRSRASRATQPDTPRPSAPAQVHEDDEAFARLIAEADSNLAQAPRNVTRTVRDFPLILLIGAEGAGKTSLIRNGGFDARLLAGQMAGSGATVSATRVANIWLANQTLLVEIGGPILQSEPARFAEFLRVMSPGRQSSRWRRWLQELQGGFRMPVLRGVILCKDTRAFVGTRDSAPPAKSAEEGQALRDRLFAITSVFGVPFPVYTVFTKADAILYFEQFFSRFPARNEGQIWGVLSKPDMGAGSSADNGVWADVETKRLNRDFATLLSRLDERRLQALTEEPAGPLPERKPAIYEFPREFKRLRGWMVQFLVDALRPDPVALTPFRRGFFFTGVRRAERVRGGGSDTALLTDASKIGSADPTVMFREDATQFLKGPTQGGGSLTDHWMFTRDIFQEVLKNDRPVVQTQAAPQAGRFRHSAIVWGSVGLAALLSMIWTVSWNENRKLIDDVGKTIEAGDIGEVGEIGGLEVRNLRALDDLRDLLEHRLDQSGPWRMHWGLYTGDELLIKAREAYFDRLGRLLLIRANANIGAQLEHVGASKPGYSQTYALLKTHITMTSAGCPVEPQTVRRTLLETIYGAHPELDETRKELIARQIDYYVRVLRKPLPVSLSASTDAIGQARAYLKNERGPEQVYENLMSEMRSSSRAMSLREEIGAYESVMSIPEIAFEFTAKGRERFEQIAGGVKPPAGEECVLGSLENALGRVRDPDLIRGARAIYYRNYADAWKSFLQGTRVKPFGLGDAAMVLDKLADSNTPLLRAIQFVARSTFFASPKPSEGNFLDKIPGVKQKMDAAAAKVAEMNRSEFGPSDVTRIFQPAHWVVQPDSPTVVTERNRLYLDGLRHLQEGFEKYRKAPATDQGNLVQPLQDALVAARAAERALADGFSNATDGVDTQVGDLLRQPLKYAEDSIPRMADPAAKINASLKSMCGPVSRVVQQYPFNQQTDREAKVQEFVDAFAPNTGAVATFQQAVGEVVVKAGAVWTAKADSKMKASPELVRFLNRAQQIADAFFPEGKLGFKYTLRPVPGQRPVKLTIDGKDLDSQLGSLQKEFMWTGVAKAEASGTYYIGGVGLPFGSYEGPWAVFRLFLDSDPRGSGEHNVRWSKMRGAGAGAKVQPIEPVTLEIVQFPGGQDIFNKAFFVPNLTCPGRAIEPQ